MPASWAGMAGVYADSFGLRCADAVPAVLQACGSPAGTLLDVGTGPGTLALAARAAGWRVLGIDSDPSMVALAREEGLDVDEGALPELPYHDASFEAVAANFVINHVPDPRAAVAEMRRVAREGAPVSLSIWASEADPLNCLWSGICDDAGAATAPGQRLPAHLDFPRTLAGVTEILAEAGLREVAAVELNWAWRILPDDLWAGVEAGIATIGHTYRTQTPEVRARMRRAFERRGRQLLDGDCLVIGSQAVLGHARR